MLGHARRFKVLLPSLPWRRSVPWMSSSRCLGDLAESQLHTGGPRGEAADRVQQVCAEVAQSRASAGLHVPVMPHEVLQAWVPPSVPADGAGCVFVDGTLGHGGHTEALLRLLPAARVIGLDTDAEMVAKARKQLAQAGVLDRATLVKAPYTHIEEVLGELGQPGATGVLVDVGFNSGQVDNAARGFSFRRDGPLDGRFDSVRAAAQKSRTAAQTAPPAPRAAHRAYRGL